MKYCAYTPKERIYITAEYKLPWYYNNQKRLTLTVKVKNDLYKYTSMICTISYKTLLCIQLLTMKDYRELQDKLNVKVTLVNLYSNSLLSPVKILPTQANDFICDPKVVPLC